MKCLVFNCTKQTLLVSELEVAETALSRMKGLIGRSARNFNAGKGLWIFPSEGIHTVGMSFPIDVAYLDSNHRVVHTCHNLRPFRFAKVKLNTQSILELPAGTLAETRTEIGDLLEFLISEEKLDKATGAGEARKFLAPEPLSPNVEITNIQNPESGALYDIVEGIIPSKRR